MEYSSERGWIFFSSISSSAKFFLYFSQLDPVAEGCRERDGGLAKLRTCYEVIGHTMLTVEPAKKRETELVYTCEFRCMDIIQGAFVWAGLGVDVTVFADE